MASLNAQNRLLVIGNGMAATELLKQLVVRGYAGRITVVGDEPGPGYNRIQLTPWLADEIEDGGLDLVTSDWYARQGIELVSADAIVHLDPAGEARTASGRLLAFDQCVLATGALPRLPGQGYKPQASIRAFRSKADGYWLKQCSADQSAVVIGGGLLGIEAAWGLRKRGLEVTLVHRNSHLLNRQLSETCAQPLHQALADAGIRLALNTELNGLDSDPTLTSISLGNGEVLRADALILAAGILPNTDLARDAGLTVERGVVVDHQLRTSAANCFAIGECAEFAGQTFGMVNPAWQQARVVAANLCGDATFYAISDELTRLKISGLDVISLGCIDHPNARQLTLNSPQTRQCRRLHLLNDRLIGAEMVGTTAHLELFKTLIHSRQTVRDARLLLLGDAKAA
ncbi:MAG: FAD-dependent oxidoreductase [Saccharospirillum sp.]|nr:FAD-dependent oxidoreductase [Saccharospirillum sp.]